MRATDLVPRREDEINLRNAELASEGYTGRIGFFSLDATYLDTLDTSDGEHLCQANNLFHLLPLPKIELCVRGAARQMRMGSYFAGSFIYIAPKGWESPLSFTARGAMPSVRTRNRYCHHLSEIRYVMNDHGLELTDVFSTNEEFQPLRVGFLARKVASGPVQQNFG